MEEEKKNRLGLKGNGSAGWFVILDKGTRADFVGEVTILQLPSNTIAPSLVAQASNIISCFWWVRNWRVALLSAPCSVSLSRLQSRSQLELYSSKGWRTSLQGDRPHGYWLEALLSHGCLSVAA